MKNKKNVMSSVVHLFEECGLTVSVPPSKTLQSKYEAAFVDFGQKYKEQPLVLQILHYSEDILSSKKNSALENEEPTLSILTFTLAFPLEIPQTTMGEILRFAALANKSLPIGNLNFSEKEHSLYFSYSIPLTDEIPSETTLMTVLSTALFAKDSFFDCIESLAQGTSTIDQLLAEAETSMTSL